jgi:predicted DsbA family dithiol-disulfide isomerase
VLAHKMAVESDNVTSDMVEAIEFPQLAIKYEVRGVPRTVINESHFVDGMVPEPVMLQELLAALEEEGEGSAEESSSQSS